jgi:hypothetical protein
MIQFRTTLDMALRGRFVLCHDGDFLLLPVNLTYNTNAFGASGGSAARWSSGVVGVLASLRSGAARYPWTLIDACVPPPCLTGGAIPAPRVAAAAAYNFMPGGADGGGGAPFCARTEECGNGAATEEGEARVDDEGCAVGPVRIDSAKPCCEGVDSVRCRHGTWEAAGGCWGGGVT